MGGVAAQQGVSAVEHCLPKSAQHGDMASVWSSSSLAQGAKMLIAVSPALGSLLEPMHQGMQQSCQS